MPLIQRSATARLPTRWGEFTMHVFEGQDTKPIVALVMGEIGNGMDVLVRIHSSCLTGDIFGSLKCDCGEQLGLAMTAISQTGRGVLIYAEHEGRGIGLIDKIRAYALQDKGADTVDANLALGLPADARDYTMAAMALKDLGVKTVRFMTNNPKKIHALERCGINVVERVPALTVPNDHNENYLETKRQRFGHMLA